MAPHSPRPIVTPSRRQLRLLLLLVAVLAPAVLTVIQHQRTRAMVEQQVRTAVEHAGVEPALALRPPLGFNDWNAVHCNVSETLMEGTAAAMVRKGLRLTSTSRNGAPHVGALAVPYAQIPGEWS